MANPEETVPQGKSEVEMGGGVDNLAALGKVAEKNPEVVYEDQVSTGHKRMDVSDEVELDEIVEEPVAAVQADRVKVKGGKGHVKILFCNS